MGPYSISVTGLCLSIVALVVAPVLVAAGAQTVTLACSRNVEVVCSVTDGVFFPSATATFPVQSAYSTHETRSGKGNKRYAVGQVVLTDRAGKRHGTLQVDYEESRAVAEHLQEFIGAAGPNSFRAELHGPRLLAAVGLLFLGMAAVLGRFALRGAGRIHVKRLAPAGLSVRRSFLGVPLGTRLLDLSGASAVTVEWKQFRDLLSKSWTASENFGRLVIETDHGTIPVSQAFSRGSSIHQLGAQRLARLIGVRSLQPAVAEDLQRLGFDWSSAGGRPAGIWVGACVGSLAGAALGALGALTLGGAHLSDSAGAVGTLAALSSV